MYIKTQKTKIQEDMSLWIQIQKKNNASPVIFLLLTKNAATQEEYFARNSAGWLIGYQNYNKHLTLIYKHINPQAHSDAGAFNSRNIHNSNNKTNRN